MLGSRTTGGETKEGSEVIRLVAGSFVVAAAITVVALTVTWSASGGTTDPQTTYQGKTAFQWHRIAVQRRVERDRARSNAGDAVRANRRLQRELARVVHSGNGPLYAIRLASAIYGVPESEMRAVASCETGGSFSPFSKNPSSTASGLFQFLDSTWASAGIPGFSVFDPIANALAAARLVIRDGGWSEWSCRP